MVITHDECMDRIMIEYSKCDKKQFTDTFIAGMTGDMTLRAGLPILAILQTFKPHKIDEYIPDSTRPDFTKCHICCCFGKEEEPEKYIKERYGVGLSENYYSILYQLQHQNKLPKDIYPKSEDFEVFKEILYLLINAKPEEKIRDIMKKIKKMNVFKENVKAARKELKEKGEKAEYLTCRYSYYYQTILETLGYCSILETQKHRGYLSKFTDIGFSPMTTHNSDWSYPVDFWKGCDGINKEAFIFWFGNYKELEEILKLLQLKGL